jgi:hypothetical protein
MVGNAGQRQGNAYYRSSKPENENFGLDFVALVSLYIYIFPFIRVRDFGRFIGKQGLHGQHGQQTAGHSVFFLLPMLLPLLFLGQQH